MVVTAASNGERIGAGLGAAFNAMVAAGKTTNIYVDRNMNKAEESGGGMAGGTGAVEMTTASNGGSVGVGMLVENGGGGTGVTVLTTMSNGESNGGVKTGSNGESSGADMLVENGGGGTGAMVLTTMSSGESDGESSGEDGVEFFSPMRDGGRAVAMAMVGAGSNGEGSASATTAPGWEIGQRVKLEERGVGTVLFVGDIHAAEGKLLPGNDLWYGVSLDGKRGLNAGCVNGVTYFHCEDKYGIFVPATKMQAVKMSNNDTTLKTLLNGGKVKEYKVKAMSSIQLRVFLDHKGVKMELIEKKDKLIPLAIKAMCAAQLPSTPTRGAESMHVTRDGDTANENERASNSDDVLILEDGADDEADKDAVGDVVQHDIKGASGAQDMVMQRDGSIDGAVRCAINGPDFLAGMGSAMRAAAPAAVALNVVVENVGVMDLEIAAIAVNAVVAPVDVMVPEAVFNTITVAGEESSTTTSPKRAPNPEMTLPETPEELDTTKMSFVEEECTELEECSLTYSEVYGRVGFFMSRFAKLVKECSAVAQSLVKGFERAPGDEGRKRQVLRCAGKALAKVGDIFKEAGAEQIGPSAAPDSVVLKVIAPWQFCPNARGPLSGVHKCSDFCSKRWKAAPSSVHDDVTSAIAPKGFVSWIAPVCDAMEAAEARKKWVVSQPQACAPLVDAVKMQWPTAPALEVTVPAVASATLGLGAMKSAVFPWRNSIVVADDAATPALTVSGSFSASFSDKGSVHGQSGQGVDATRAAIAKMRQSMRSVDATRAAIAKPAAGIAGNAEDANGHRQEPKPVVAPPVLGGPIHDGRLPGLRGTIVNINHAKQFAFIRSTQFSTDFFVGRQHFHPEMAMGDVVMFRGHPEVKQRGGRCPDAAGVDLVAREGQQTRQVAPLPLFGAWANAPAHVNQQPRQVAPVPAPPVQGVTQRPSLEVQVEALTRMVQALLTRVGDGTAGMA